jgi:hypothetical protein
MTDAAATPNPAANLKVVAEIKAGTVGGGEFPGGGVACAAGVSFALTKTDGAAIDAGALRAFTFFYV